MFDEFSVTTNLRIFHETKCVYLFLSTTNANNIIHFFVKKICRFVVTELVKLSDEFVNYISTSCIFLLGSLGQHKTMYLQDNSASRVLEAALVLLEVQEDNKGHESQKQSKICLRKF